MPRMDAALPRNRNPLSSGRSVERAPQGRPQTYLTLREPLDPQTTAEPAYDGTDRGSQRIEHGAISGGGCAHFHTSASLIRFNARSVCGDLPEGAARDRIRMCSTSAACTSTRLR